MVCSNVLLRPKHCMLCASQFCLALVAQSFIQYTPWFLLLHLNTKWNGDAGKGLFGDASGGKGGTQEGEWDKQTWQLKVKHAGRQFDN